VLSCILLNLTGTQGVARNCTILLQNNSFQITNNA
jgi:hypothetical protein